MIAKPATFAFLVCLSFLLCGVAAARAGATTPPALRPALYRALARNAAPAYRIGKDGCTTLPKQRLTGCFTVEGSRFVGTDARMLALRLTSWGRGQSMHAVSRVAPSIAGNRVSYSHGALTEWWRVLPLGFEQGFTISRRPAGHGELNLLLTAGGDPVARDGTVTIGTLRYGDLVVTDAAAKVLRSRLIMKRGRILIAVDDAGARYPLTVDPLVWIEQKVTASDGMENDDFGYAVAINGNTAIVGTKMIDSIGAAYVFTESGGVWNQSQKLTANDGAAPDGFGWSVALQGTTALIGAVGASPNGAAYVYTESNGVWTQTAKLTANDGTPYDSYGQAVALGADIAFVGAPTAGGTNGSGKVYVFTESGNTWAQTQELTAADAVGGEDFGSSVALSGSTALIGAETAPVNGNPQQGAAYVFTQSGGTWSQTQKLTASDGAAYDYFGNALAFDGTTALIGALNAKIGSNAAQGAAYVFTQSGGTWSQTQKLTASDGAANDSFGSAFAFYGTTALIGAENATVGSNVAQGAAYVFTQSGGTWSQTGKLVASDGAAADFFGGSLALDGSEAVIGAAGADVGGTLNQGASYFYGSSDLGLAISAPANVTQGGSYTSQIIVTNSSSLASAAVAVTSAVPAGATFVSVNATQGSCSQSSGIVSCDFGAINGNGGTATANVTLKASGNAGETIENSAGISNATPAVTASASTEIQSSGGGGGGGSSGGGGGGVTAPLSIALVALLGFAGLARRRL